MRIDLTQGSYRVLRRAGTTGYVPLAGLETTLTPEKVLLALYEEEECRAAAWLAEAGLTVEQFRADFRIEPGAMKLLSAISAPPFPMGHYGISPGIPGSDASVHASPEYRVAGSIPDRPVSPRELPPQTVSRQEPDRVDFSRHSHETPTATSPGPFDRPKPPQTLRFYLDGETVEVNRVTAELAE
ncbi:MAG TPA: hypothetical protein DEB39_13485, partial [Planctomycetaceae bacterium]|nr:hypothetical protein [Planctomycetaceae bacterium]